jgi:hypothetical protein
MTRLRTCTLIDIRAFAMGTCCGSQVTLLAATQSLNSLEKGVSLTAAPAIMLPLLLAASAALKRVMFPRSCVDHAT